ncbi:unnamed protein product [Arabis nemorensis]|uniref:Uncharacterized protein n=1 Tax=Arabis nemorensis TaxID=586526 RepID=A0A565ASK5_9BRAS|nr:unnamed protein product [Arabis nemorensis]
MSGDNNIPADPKLLMEALVVEMKKALEVEIVYVHQRIDEVQDRRNQRGSQRAERNPIQRTRYEKAEIYYSRDSGVSRRSQRRPRITR